MPRLISFTQNSAVATSPRLIPIGRTVKKEAAPVSGLSSHFKPQKARSVRTGRSASPAIRLGQRDLTKSLVYGLGALVLFMAVTYVISINSSSTSGYQITKLQKSVNGLVEENKKLTLQNAEINSMASINDAAWQSGFVPVTSMEYVQLSHSQLTQR